MRTLKNLCNPDPRTMECPYDRVQAAMLKRFGPEVADAGYFNAFQLVMTSGGKQSESWSEFFKWADLFVDESRRRIRLDAYAVFVPYPHQ